MSPTTAHRPGSMLRRARELAGLNERAAARALGVRRTRLRELEAGAAVPTADEMDRAIAVYSVDLDSIWPDRTPLVSSSEPGVLVVGDERIEVSDHRTAAGGTDNRVILTRYLAAVRRQRGLEHADPVELRAGDIASLASVLDLDDAALEQELTELLDLTPAGARWTTRALVVGGLMAVAATAVVGTSWFSAAAPAGAAALPSAPAAVSAPFTPEITPTTDVSARATVQFAPEEAAPDAPIEAEVVAPTTETSPFSTEPSATEVELAPAMFAVAPATEWSPVVEAPPELPPATPAG